MEQIPWYKSNTLRALLVAGVVQVLVWLNVSDTISSDQAQALVDKAFDIIEGVALAWAAYARIKQPTPPISASAASKMGP